MPAPLRKDDTTGTTRSFSSPFGSTACLFEIALRCPGSIPRLAIGLLIFVSFAGVAFAATELFGPAALRYPAGTAAADLATGDLNADGVRDLAVADSEGNTVRLLRGTGDGRFDPLATIAVDGRPGSLVLADFDGDGRADVAVAATQSGRVSLLPAPDFAPVTLIELGTGTGPHPLAAGDFDGDGDLDLAVASAARGTVAVLLGNGSGSFALLLGIPVGNRPVSIAGGDLNADGRDDLVVANRSNRFATVLLAQGSGAFVRRDLAVTFNPTTVALGDLNQDGTLDLAVAGTRLNVFLGAGQGLLIPAGDFALGQPPDDLTAGDLDGDGVLDLLAVRTAVRAADRSLRVLRGDGTGSFALVANLTSGGAALVAEDLDGDGALDVAVVGGDALRVMAGDGQGGLADITRVGVGGGQSAVVGSGLRFDSTRHRFVEKVFDLNRDGMADLAVTLPIRNRVACAPGQWAGRVCHRPDGGCRGRAAGALRGGSRRRWGPGPCGGERGRWDREGPAGRRHGGPDCG